MPFLSNRSVLGRFVVAFTLFIVAATATEISENESTLIATGIGRRTVTTSIADIRLGVEDRKPTPIEVQESVANKSSVLLAYLNATETAVDNLQTTGIALQPELDYSKSPANITGYTASNTVSFEVPISRSGNVLDTAVNRGATRIIRVEFRATPSINQDARLDAIEDAVEHATVEARAAARAAGMLIGKVTHLRIDDTFYQAGIEQDHAKGRIHLMAAESAPSTPIIPQDQVIEARVTITFLVE